MISVLLHDDCKGGRGDRGLYHTTDSLDALAQSRDSARQGKMVMRVESLCLTYGLDASWRWL